MAGTKVRDRKVMLGVKDDPSTFKEVKWVESSGKFKYFQGVSNPSPESEPMTKPATIINKLSHSVVLSYNGEGMMVHPHQRAVIANIDKLGALPRGVVDIPNFKK